MEKWIDLQFGQIGREASPPLLPFKWKEALQFIEGENNDKHDALYRFPRGLTQRVRSVESSYAGLTVAIYIVHVRKLGETISLFKKNPSF